MIKVTTVDGTKFDVTTACAWHVDDHGGLHLQATDKKPVASFAATKWIAVQKTE